MIIEIAAAAGTIGATAYALALRAKARRAPPRTIVVTNGGRAVLAYWLEHTPWTGDDVMEIRRALSLHEFTVHRDGGGVQGMRLPFPRNDPPSLTGRKADDARNVREFNKRELARQADWLEETMSVRLSEPACALALRGLRSCAVPTAVDAHHARLLEALA